MLESSILLSVFFNDAMDFMGKCIDATGVAIMLVGATVATISYARVRLNTGPDEESYRDYRRGLGKSILLGLELLVAGDIIRTVATSPTLESVAVLALIVLIRT